MNIADVLKQTGAIDSISRELGIDRQSAQSGASALLPALLGGFKKQAQMEASSGGSPTGTRAGAAGGGLLGLLGSMGGGGNLLESVTSPQPTPKEPGNQILGQIFGSKDVSRTVAGQAAQNTGIDPAILKKMLPLLAMAVTGYLASRGGTAQQGAGTGGGLLGQMLGAGGPRSGQQAQGGSLLGLLDMDGDGNPLDDILRMAGKLRR